MLNTHTHTLVNGLMIGLFALHPLMWFEVSWPWTAQGYLSSHLLFYLEVVI